MEMLDAFSTPAAHPPAAFHRLRRELHAAAGADRVAISRARDTVSTLRTRADFFRDAMLVHAGTGLGVWYSTVAIRLEHTAELIEREAVNQGVLS